MEIDPLDLVNAVATEHAPKSPWLNSAVAITVALLATFMGICKVKDDNVVQAMQQAQSDKIDHWQFYQARNIREEIAKSTILQLRLQKSYAPKQMHEQINASISEYELLKSDQERKKAELKLQAEGDQVKYDTLSFQDDQFDLSDAAIAIAISVLAVTSLTQLVWLFGLALVPATFGVVMGLAGLAGWSLHPNLLSQLLN